MSRRKRIAELESGSDSFLDIIANIVGILIILIVIAGVRVSQLPNDVSDDKADLPIVVEPLSDPEPIEETPLLVLEAELGEAAELPAAEILPPEIVAPVVQTPVEPDPEPARPPEPSPQLLAEITLLEQDIRKLEADAADMVPRLAKTVQSKQTAEEEILATELESAEQLREFKNVSAKLEKRKQEIEDDMTHLSLLADEFETRKTPQPKVKNLTHRLTPVSKVVEGDEFHFRLEHNRVSHIPLNQLLGELKSQIERRKSWLAKSRAHHGYAGPIAGYSLRYLVERQPLSVVEELQYGSGTFRVTVSAWQLQVDEDVATESAQEALQIGSRFVNSLKKAEAKTTLTFWVYPDSFGLFRQLQEVAHANGFIVAARPLPDGVPIAGSPSGTRSAGQ